MRSLVGLTLLAVALTFTGCGPHVERQELGETLFEVPKVAGSDEPYPLENLTGPQPGGGTKTTEKAPDRN